MSAATARSVEEGNDGRAADGLEKDQESFQTGGEKIRHFRQLKIGKSAEKREFG
jgi:hypothetical protein